MLIFICLFLLLNKAYGSCLTGEVQHTNIDGVTICTKKLATVLQSSQSQCGQQGELDIWVNTAVASSEIYTLASDSWSIGQLTVSNILNIPTSSIKTEAINNNAITNDKISQNAVGTGQLIADSVTNDKIASNAVGSSQLMSNSVTAAKIVDGTITSADFSSSATCPKANTVQIRTTSNSYEWNLPVAMTSTFSSNNQFQTILNQNQLQFNPLDNKLYFGSHVTNSDRRIKKNIRPVPDIMSVNIIRKLDTKYYNYIDKNRAEANAIGFIAQEVKEVIPEAVSIKENIIAWKQDYVVVEWLSEENGYAMKLEESIEPGEYTFLMDNEIHLRLKTADGTTFKTNTKYSKVFLNGKKIDDFHYIDKQKIFAVAYSALQQVDKNQQALQKKVTQLEATIESLIKRLDTLESK